MRFKKVIPISLRHQIGPMGIVKGCSKKETGPRREQLAHPTELFMQTRCQEMRSRNSIELSEKCLTR